MMMPEKGADALQVRAVHEFHAVTHMLCFVIAEPFVLHPTADTGVTSSLHPAEGLGVMTTTFSSSA